MKRPSDADKRVLTESEYRKLHGLYTSLNHPSAVGSISNLRKASGLPRKKVLAYLETSKTYTKFKPAQRKFPRLPVISLGINHIWSLDVAYMEKIAKFNDGVKYLLLAVDSLSRKIRVQPLKSKTALAAKLAFERMVNFETSEFPIKLWVDEGKEFKGEFKKFCRENQIEVYHTYSETKSCMAESYIRTLKTLLYKYFEEYQTFRYIPQLQKFVSLVKKRQNPSIGMAADDVNAKHVPHLVSLQKRQSFPGSKPKFKVGDRVRIAFKEMPFEKGYKQQYANEVFKLSRVCVPEVKGPVTYKLLDSKDEPILGKFYTPELTHFKYLQDRGRSRHQTISFATS